MSNRNKPLIIDDTDQGLLLGFVEEYYKSNEFKKASLIIDSLKSDIQPIRLFCAKRLSELGKILGIHQL